MGESRRWLLVGLGVAAALVLGVLLRKAESSGGGTQPPESLATVVATKLADHPEEAALTALDAAGSEPSTEAELAMVDVAVDGRGLERVIDTGRDEVTAALVLGREMVTAGDDGVVKVWQRPSGKLLGQTRASAPLAALAESESSSRFLAAVGRDGSMALVDVNDPGRPRVLPLEGGLPRAERPLAVSFSQEADEIVAVGSRGGLVRANVTTGEVVGRSSIWGFRGDLPWDRHSGGSVTAARFLPEVYEDEEGLLLATADGAVADLDLARGQGKTILQAGVAPGRVLSLDRMPYGETELVVGTAGGLVLLGEDFFEEEPLSYPGPPVPAVAIDEGGVRRGGEEGLLFGAGFEQPATGPPILRFEPGLEGLAAVLPGGKVSAVGAPGVGMSMAETEFTPVAAFDGEGRLLVAEGYDANHVESVQAVRPQARATDDEYQEDEVVQTYRPDRDWWPEAEDPEALYLNDVAADDEHVFAAGQDPNGDATVLVWDAESGEPLQHLVLGTGGLSTELPSIVTEIMLLPEQEEIAAYSAAQELVSIWSTETWELEESVPVGAVGDVAASPDGSTIVTVGIDPDWEGYVGPEDPTELTFVDVEEGEVEDRIKTRGVSAAAFSPDGSTLALADENGFLRLRSSDGREPKGLVKVGGAAEALAWRPDGKLVAVALGAGGVVLADPESGEVSKPLPEESPITTQGLDWSSDGASLAALAPILDEEGEGYDPGPIAIWTLDAATLKRRMCALAACRPDGPPAGGELGDASRLSSVDVVFREEERLLAADLEGERALIGFAEEYPTPPAAYDWAEDGFAWTSPGGVGVLLAGDEKPRFWPCACSGVAWDGAEVVSLEIGGRRVVRIDPGEESPRTTPTRGVPPHLPGLVGVVGDSTIVSAFEREPDRSTPSALFALDSGGTARKITGDAHGSVYLRWPSSSPDSLAFLAGLSSGVCYSTTNVGVVSAGAGGRIDLSFPRSPFGDEPTYVRSLQVSAEGEVGAAIAPIGCDDRGYPEDELPPAQRYVLVDGSWRSTGAEGFDVQLAGGAELVEETEDTITPGTLFVEAPGGREEIATRAEAPVGRP
ncbi:MAG TPA: hypothetical protein VF125_07835 [Solirubrobacterales bacterium]